MKSHWLHYTTFPSGELVSWITVSQDGFMVLVCRLKPSLLIKALHAYQSNSLHGRDDVFCLVQLTPLTLQGVKPHEQQWIRRLHPSSFHQNWTEPLKGSVSRLVFLSLHKVTGYFTHTHTHCCPLYWLVAFAPAIREPCFTQLSHRWRHFAHQSCLCSCGLSSRTRTM